MQMSLSAEERSERVQRRQGTPGRPVLNSGWQVQSVAMLPPNVDVDGFSYFVAPSSRISRDVPDCAMLSRVPARPAPGRQMARISRCSQNENNDLKSKKKNSNNSDPA